MKTVSLRVMMADNDSISLSLVFFLLFVLLTAITVTGDSLDSDREVLLRLKSYLESRNPTNRGVYTEWGIEKQADVCQWPGITCAPQLNRVTGVNLSDSTIAGVLFGNFSALTELTYLDLSRNTIEGSIPEDLSRCHNLRHLNLSHNILEGELSLSGLSNLEVLDLSLNRIIGDIQTSFPLFCNNLVVANLSTNNLTGRIDNIFNGCRQLKYVDFSSNGFIGEVWDGFGRLVQFSVAENHLSGNISASMFRGNCTLQVLDLSENDFGGEFPGQVANCQNMRVLNLWGNSFRGRIPAEIGSITSLRGLYLGKNGFSRDIPETLLNLSNLVFLDLSNNNFGGDIQEIFGRFTQVKYLVLHGNSFVGGIYSSNILKLPNLSRLDLSYNKFSGRLPAEISEIQSLKFLILAYNNFSGDIPEEYGNMSGLQALDLSFNNLTGSIPVSFGKLTSLLWLMLANNSLSGEIPREIGNCTSLLWLNLANNQLSGGLHPELTKVGSNPFPTFEVNRLNSDDIIAGSGECLAMKRWIPAEFPPFKFVYALLTKKSCRSIWDHVLKGNGLFPFCSVGSTVRTLDISGYLQLSGNKLSGEIPADISEMKKLSMLHLGFNDFEGKLPPEIGQLPLAFLNLTRNHFSGKIPQEIGNLKCLQNLDLSYNNFSGNFPTSLNDLTELSKFNISYNPLISGVMPTTGQLATFDKDSFLGNPLIQFPSYLDQSKNNTKNQVSHQKLGNMPRTLFLVLISFALALTFIVCLVVLVLVLVVAKSSREAEADLLDGSKTRHDTTSISGGSSPWLSGKIKVIRLDKSTFTYADILKATSNFSEERVVGRGGYGTVYRGTFPDGREVAVKKLQREGTEAEKEFRAEMEVLSANAFGDWAHPNLVKLYGWCLDGSEKILVHEYMEGGSLEELITDKTKLPWKKRVDIATDVARALVFLHHECYPAIVHRDVKASNVLLDQHGNARVTDFGLARVLNVGDSHVSTVIAGTVGYVAPEYCQTWQATTRGDVYSYGVLTMELATGRRAVDGGEECLVEWARRVMTGNLTAKGSPFTLSGTKPGHGAEELTELLKVGVKCTADNPQARPNMKEILAMLVKISGKVELFNGMSPPGYIEM